MRDGRGRARLREALDGVRDVERLAGRAAAGRATPRELGALRDSFLRLPDVSEALSALAASTLPRGGRAAALARRGGRARPAGRPRLGARPRARGPPPAIARRRRRHPRRVRCGARRAPLAPRRWAAVHRLAPAARARAHRHPVAQGRLQQGLRLLPRDHQRPLGQGPGRLRAAADAGVRRALRHARAQGIRSPGARRGGADGHPRGRAVRCAARGGGTGHRPDPADGARAGPARRVDRARRARSQPAATSGPRCTTATTWCCARAAIRSSSG